MADGLSDYAQEGVLRLLLNRSQPVPSGTVYLAVGTAAAQESDVDTWPDEVSGGGYQRQVIDFLPAPSAQQGSVNARSVFFPTASASWGSIGFWSIWTAQSGGKMLAFGDFFSALSIGSGAILRVPKGAVKVFAYTAPGGTQFSSYLHKKLCDHMFAKRSFSSPNIHLALAGTEPTIDTTGSQLNEQSGNGYARKAWSAWNDPTQTVDDYGRATNNGAINFNTATADWSVSPNYLVLTDASSGGNMLCWDACGGGAILNGDTPHFDDAAIAVLTRNLV